MQPLFLLIGPPAVGKSTTSRALAARFGKSIHIPVDDIRNMVVSGLVLPSADWTPELGRQVTLARESAILVALQYRQAGYAVVMDDFVDPNRLREYRTLLNDPHVHKFVLFPTQETAHARNFRRAGDDPGRDYIDEGIRTVYRQLHLMIADLLAEGWIVLDTTGLSVEETLREILQQSENSSR